MKKKLILLLLMVVVTIMVLSAGCVSEKSSENKLLSDDAVFVDADNNVMYVLFWNNGGSRNFVLLKQANGLPLLYNNNVKGEINIISDGNEPTVNCRYNLFYDEDTSVVYIKLIMIYGFASRWVIVSPMYEADGTMKDINNASLFNTYTKLQDCYDAEFIVDTLTGVEYLKLEGYVLNRYNLDGSLKVRS